MPVLDRRLLVFLACLALAALGGLALSSHFSRKLAVARHDAEQALADFDSAQAIAARNGIRALRAEAKADTLQAAADSEHQRAERAERRLAAHRATFDAVAAQAPDTCAPAIAAARVALADADSSLAHEQARGDSLVKASQSLHVALDSTRAALTTVLASGERLGHATRALVDASEPSIFERLLPSPVVVVAMGLDRNGQMHSIAGIGLGWRF